MHSDHVYTNTNQHQAWPSHKRSLFSDNHKNISALRYQNDNAICSATNVTSPQLAMDISLESVDTSIAEQTANSLTINPNMLMKDVCPDVAQRPHEYFTTSLAKKPLPPVPPNDMDVESPTFNNHDWAPQNLIDDSLIPHKDSLDLTGLKRQMSDGKRNDEHGEPPQKIYGMI